MEAICSSRSVARKDAGNKFPPLAAWLLTDLCGALWDRQLALRAHRAWRRTDSLRLRVWCCPVLESQSAALDSLQVSTSRIASQQPTRRMRPEIVFELCVDTVEAALAAEQGGADRALQFVGGGRLDSWPELAEACDEAGLNPCSCNDPAARREFSLLRRRLGRHGAGHSLRRR